MVKTIQITSDKNINESNEIFREHMILDFGTDEDIKNLTSVMKPDLKNIERQISLLEWEAESLRIDKVCLEQKNHELQTRIDDLAQQYPSASVLLGKTPILKTSVWDGLKSKLLKK